VKRKLRVRSVSRCRRHAPARPDYGIGSASPTRIPKPSAGNAFTPGGQSRHLLQSGGLSQLRGKPAGRLYAITVTLTTARRCGKRRRVRNPGVPQLYYAFSRRRSRSPRLGSMPYGLGLEWPMTRLSDSAWKPADLCCVNPVVAWRSIRHCPGAGRRSIWQPASPRDSGAGDALSSGDGLAWVNAVFSGSLIRNGRSRQLSRSTGSTSPGLRSQTYLPRSAPR